MALGDDFINLEDLQNYMKVSSSEGFDDQLTEAIASSTAEIIRHCHRDFNVAEMASTRMYFPILHPESGPMIQTDDISTAEGLVVACDDTSFNLSSLILRPLNGVMQGMTGWPYTSIEGAFTIGRPVMVTALWGWSAIPKPVREAAYFISQDTFQLKDQRLGIAGSDAFGQVISVKDNRAASLKLKKFVRDSVLMDS